MRWPVFKWKLAGCIIGAWLFCGLSTNAEAGQNRVLPGETLENKSSAAIYLYVRVAPGEKLRNGLPVPLRLLDARAMENLLKPLLIQARVDSLNGLLNRLKDQIQTVDDRLKKLQETRENNSTTGEGQP